jgi:hypothetical protein
MMAHYMYINAPPMTTLNVTNAIIMTLSASINVATRNTTYSYKLSIEDDEERRIIYLENL